MKDCYNWSGVDYYLDNEEDDDEDLGSFDDGFEGEDLG